MNQASLSDYVKAYFENLKSTIDAMPVDRIEAMGEILFQSYRHGKQVFVIGNGGSGATASHLACDLAKNTICSNRPRFRILSLNDNMPLFSALANDLGYERVFAEQLMNLIRPGDVLVAISGSGNSPNILEAMRYARDRAATTIALLGFEGGAAIELADEYILVPAFEYGLIEDMHMVLNHVLTGYFTERLEHYELATA